MSSGLVELSGGGDAMSGMFVCGLSSWAAAKEMRALHTRIVAIMVRARMFCFFIRVTFSLGMGKLDGLFSTKPANKPSRNWNHTCGCAQPAKRDTGVDATNVKRKFEKRRGGGARGFAV